MLSAAEEKDTEKKKGKAHRKTRKKNSRNFKNLSKDKMVNRRQRNRVQKKRRKGAWREGEVL